MTVVAAYVERVGAYFCARTADHVRLVALHLPLASCMRRIFPDLARPAPVRASVPSVVPSALAPADTEDEPWLRADPLPTLSPSFPALALPSPAGSSDDASMDACPRLRAPAAVAICPCPWRTRLCLLMMTFGCVAPPVVLAFVCPLPLFIDSPSGAPRPMNLIPGRNFRVFLCVFVLLLQRGPQQTANPRCRHAILLPSPGRAVAARTVTCSAIFERGRVWLAAGAVLATLSHREQCQQAWVFVMSHRVLL